MVKGKASKTPAAPPSPDPEPPAEDAPAKPLVRGKLAIRADPRVFQKELPFKAVEYRRIVGIDLGTNCGFAFCDIIPGQPIRQAPIVAGIWDLSLGDYDSGPLRHIRLKQFLAVAEPELLMYEEVKYDPPAELLQARNMGPGAIVARVASAAEFLGGLKVTVSSWCEEHGVPAQGVAIAQIKKFATGKGNANKVDMIKAANETYGLSLDPEGYERSGVDNIADAVFVCAMGVQLYSEGLK